jgi:uncharacterized protein (DUF697 family)
MNKDIILLILYPIQTLSLNSNKREKIFEILNKEFKDLTEDDLLVLLELDFSSQDLKRIADSIEDKNKIKFFKLSKSIIEVTELSKNSIKKLSEVGKALKIDKLDTDFDFNIYDINEINEFEYKKTLRSFSMVAAAIGFIPFVPVSDFAILSVIHIGMISKIANIYNFKIQPKEFLKMISGALGIGILLKLTTKILNSFIPFIGWVINASVAYAGTYAIGIITKRYIEENGNLTKESIKSIWEKSFKEGKDEFWELKDYIYKKKNELIKEIEKYKNKAKTNQDFEETTSVDIKEKPTKTKKGSKKKTNKKK